MRESKGSSWEENQGGLKGSPTTTVLALLQASSRMLKRWKWGEGSTWVPSSDSASSAHVIFETTIRNGSLYISTSKGIFQYSKKTFQSLNDIILQPYPLFPSSIHWVSHVTLFHWVSLLSMPSPPCSSTATSTMTGPWTNASTLVTAPRPQLFSSRGVLWGSRGRARWGWFEMSAISWPNDIGTTLGLGPHWLPELQHSWSISMPWVAR
jgi:hypothetical protein